MQSPHDEAKREKEKEKEKERNPLDMMCGQRYASPLYRTLVFFAFPSRCNAHDAVADDGEHYAKRADLS